MFKKVHNRGAQKMKNPLKQLNISILNLRKQVHKKKVLDFKFVDRKLLLEKYRRLRILK